MYIFIYNDTQMTNRNHHMNFNFIVNGNTGVISNKYLNSTIFYPFIHLAMIMMDRWC